MWAVGAILYVVLAGCHPFDPAGNATAEEMVGSTLTLTLTLALTLILTLAPTVTLTLTLTLPNPNRHPNPKGVDRLR